MSTSIEEGLGSLLVNGGERFERLGSARAWSGLWLLFGVMFGGASGECQELEDDGALSGLGFPIMDNVSPQRFRSGMAIWKGVRLIGVNGGVRCGET